MPGSKKYTPPVSKRRRAAPHIDRTRAKAMPAPGIAIQRMPNFPLPPKAQ